jgi:hypothetical protein
VQGRTGIECGDCRQLQCANHAGMPASAGTDRLPSGNGSAGASWTIVLSMMCSRVSQIMSLCQANPNPVKQHFGTTWIKNEYKGRG